MGFVCDFLRGKKMFNQYRGSREEYSYLYVNRLGECVKSQHMHMHSFLLTHIHRMRGAFPLLSFLQTCPGIFAGAQNPQDIFQVWSKWTEGLSSRCSLHA